jgi:uncharacterized protein (DUF58 family)
MTWQTARQGYHGATGQGAGVTVTVTELARLRNEAGRLTGSGSFISSLLSGPHHSLLRGRGLEFDETRAYQAGDDYRHLDWRVTARTGRLHTKLFHEERERSLYLLLDASPSMHFGTRNAFKWVSAARAAAIAAWLAVDNGNRVGGLIFGVGSNLLLSPPATGEAGALQLFHLWEGIQSATARATAHQRAGLAEALARLHRQARPGSLILIFSDFSTIDPACEAHLAYLGKHTDMAALLIYDPLEQALPTGGRYPFSDGERMVMVDTYDGELRSRYRKHFDEHKEAVAALCRRHTLRFLTLGTQQSHLACFREGK